MRVGEQAPADPQDHRTVPLDQRRQSRLVAPRREPFQKLAIIQSGDRPALEKTIHLPQQLVIARHTVAPKQPFARFH